jgi:hypothetical protein
MSSSKGSGPSPKKKVKPVTGRQKSLLEFNIRKRGSNESNDFVGE